MFLKEFGEIGVKLSRNPLGVIAFTLVLVYAIAGLAFNFNSNLSEFDLHLITWFIVLYPVLVFIGLCFLVARHHQKLYGPSDYPSEQGFMQTFLTTGQQPVASVEQEEPPNPTGMEAIILNTLWSHQVNLSPRFEQQWCFHVGPNTPEFLSFHEASGRLIRRGLATMIDKWMIHLTHAGWAYCKVHYKEFPEDDFIKQEPIDPKKMKQALEEG